eukprot:6461559-Amphidinium_carterae.1
MLLNDSLTTSRDNNDRKPMQRIYTVLTLGTLFHLRIILTVLRTGYHPMHPSMLVPARSSERMRKYVRSTMYIHTYM